MPTFKVTAPDGSIIPVNAPEGATEQQAIAFAAETWKPEAQESRKWSDVPGEALRNIPKSAGDFVGGIYQAVRHPIDTGMNLLDAAAGGLRNLTADYAPSLANAMDGEKPNPNSLRASQTAASVGRFYKDRYGSVEGLKKTLATDPVGSLADVSTIFSGGAMLAPKASKAASVLNKASTLTNPVSIASKSVSKAVPYIGSKVADVVGGLGTHTGGEGLKQAARSGMEGGQSAKSFRQNMRGQTPMTDVLEAAKSNLDEMGRAKSAEYRAGMSDISGDKTILSFDGIDSAIKNASSKVMFKGQVKNQKAAEALQKISDDVNEWKGLDPAQYHTPEGLDALKQRIGAVVESIPFEEKTARMVGDNVYHSIKGEITKQAPKYADVMKGYSEATDQIKEIERTLSLGKKASVDTAMRKLQSLMRNNVNTNYGNRLNLAKQLETQGGREIMPALAGQSLNAWTPRGLGGAVGTGVGMGGYLVGGAPLAIPMLASQSPRLMGEVAFKAGQATRLAKKALPAKIGKMSSAQIANLLYQAGRLPQQ